MSKITARQLLRTLNEGNRPVYNKLNFTKWRAECREIRNALIKLRDRAEDEKERLDDAWGQVSAAESEKVEVLYDRIEDAIDNIAEAINNIDRIL